MSETNQKIALEREKLAVGEELKGRIAGAPGSVSGIFVALVWRTVGDGFDDERVVAAEEAAGAGPDGPQFTFVIPPSGPMSYAGQTFSIEWLVRIGKDASTEKRFAVTAGRQKGKGEK